jgi:hypothetical protein
MPHESVMLRFGWRMRRRDEGGRGLRPQWDIEVARLYQYRLSIQTWSIST